MGPRIRPPRPAAAVPRGAAVRARWGGPPTGGAKARAAPPAAADATAQGVARGSSLGGRPPPGVVPVTRPASAGPRRRRFPGSLPPPAQLIGAGPQVSAAPSMRFTSCTSPLSDTANSRSCQRRWRKQWVRPSWKSKQ